MNDAKRNRVRRLRIADHEATHAVVAVYLRMPISDARIDNCRNPRHAGEVNLKVPRHIRLIRAFRENRETGCFVRIDMEAKKEAMERKSAEKNIMICCAGRLGPFSEEAGCSGDEKIIRRLQKKFNISNARVAQLRLRTWKIVQRAHIQESIEQVSTELLVAPSGIVLGKRIREIYKDGAK
jgi:hypothetical protein